MENEVLDKMKLPSPPAGLVVTCVHHCLGQHLGKTFMTTCLQTETSGPFE